MALLFSKEKFNEIKKKLIYKTIMKFPVETSN